MKPVFTLVLFVVIAFSCNEKPDQSIHGRLEITDHSEPSDSLYSVLKSLDSLMFEQSYNQLNMDILRELAVDDIEFYHDQAGATYNKTDFINGMSGLGKLSYKARRELVPGTTQVFPMYENGALYAAILMAEHRFYAKEPNDKPEYLTSSAKYCTLWILKEDKWLMSRIYSFDHRAPSD